MSIESVKSCAMNEEVWVDYFEGEITGSRKQDLDLHLAGCAKCAAFVRDLGGLRNNLMTSEMEGELIKKVDFDALHAKIMKAVEASDPAQGHVVVLRGAAAARFRNFMIPLAASAAFILLVVGSLYKSSRLEGEITPEVAQSKLEEQFMSQADAQMISNSMMSQQGEDDIFMNVTAEKMSKMSDREAWKLLQKLK